MIQVSDTLVPTFLELLLLKGMLYSLIHLPHTFQKENLVRKVNKKMSLHPSSLSLHTYTQGTNSPPSSSESSANKTLEFWDPPRILGVFSIVRRLRGTKGGGTSRRWYWQGKSANRINSWSLRRWLTPGGRTLGGFTI